MFSTFITVALFVSLAIQGASASFAISTPKLVQCGTAQISWAKSVPPYTIEVVPAHDPCGEALDTMKGLTSTILDYTSSATAGTSLVFYIVDAADNEAWSGEVTIGSSPNSTCIPGLQAPSAVNTPAVSPTHTTGSSASPSSLGLGGAINAGSLRSSGALSVRQASTPLLAITALAAMLALTLY